MTAQNFKPFLAPRNKVPTSGISRGGGYRRRGYRKK